MVFLKLGQKCIKDCVKTFAISVYKNILLMKLDKLREKQERRGLYKINYFLISITY